jgi:hypothetical protein
VGCHYWHIFRNLKTVLRWICNGLVWIVVSELLWVEVLQSAMTSKQPIAHVLAKYSCNYHEAAAFVLRSSAAREPAAAAARGCYHTHRKVRPMEALRQKERRSHCRVAQELYGVDDRHCIACIIEVRYRGVDPTVGPDVIAVRGVAPTHLPPPRKADRREDLTSRLSVGLCVCWELTVATLLCVSQSSVKVDPKSA